jgi:hypothetical protein
MDRQSKRRLDDFGSASPIRANGTPWSWSTHISFAPSSFVILSNELDCYRKTKWWTRRTPKSRLTSLLDAPPDGTVDGLTLRQGRCQKTCTRARDARQEPNRG